MCAVSLIILRRHSQPIAQMVTGVLLLSPIACLGFGGLKDQGLAHMCLVADEALGKTFLAQDPPKSQPPSESPSPSPPKPPAPSAKPSTAPVPPAEALQQPQAQAAGQLASAQLGALSTERRPQLWPSGGNPLAAIPQLPGLLLHVAVKPCHMLSVSCSSMHSASSDAMFCCLRIQTELSRGQLAISIQKLAKN